MKTFNDIVFKPHKYDPNGLHGLLFFENGYGISICRFMMSGRYASYTNNDKEWELAIIKGNSPEEFELVYDTGITDDVMGNLSDADVTDILQKVQQLPKQ